MREYVYMKRVKLAFEEPCAITSLYSWTDGIAVLFGVKGPFGLKAIIQAEFDGRSRGGIFTYTLGDRLMQTRTHTHTHTYICIYTHFFKLRYSQISKDKTEIYFSGTVLNQYFFLTCQQQHTFV